MLLFSVYCLGTILHIPAPNKSFGLKIGSPKVRQYNADNIHFNFIRSERAVSQPFELDNYSHYFPPT